MKKAYDIKINDLKDLLLVLRQFSNEPTVQTDIYCLSNYISRYERNFSDERLSLYERLLDDADDVHFYKPFYPLSRQLASLGRNQDELSFETKYSTIKLSDEQVMEDADIFFREQGDFFHSTFSEFQDEAYDHLKFVNTNAETSGEVLTLKSTGDAFVFVPNHSNITKFTILIHESEHVIDFFNNPDFLTAHAVSETASLFMELIACDFIAKKYQLFDDNFQRRNFLHTIIKSQAALLKDKIELLDLVNKKRNLDEQSLLIYLGKHEFTKEDIKFYLEATINQDNAYQIPYMIAVELYVLYHHNKKLALTILQDIILNANQYNIFEILGKYGITLNQNMLYYEDCLYKKITL